MKFNQLSGFWKKCIVFMLCAIIILVGMIVVYFIKNYLPLISVL